VKLVLPYYEDKTRVSVGSETVDVKAFQIILWLSVSSQRSDDWDPRTPRFPAILDVGNNHNFAISDEHLIKWAGIQSASMHALKKIREKGTTIPLRSAALWLHANDAVFRLNVDEGIAVYPTDGPRLPILGLRAITNTKLRALIHGDQKRVILRTPPPWYWPI
jgi:hypothetical protein